jgi:trk system potassium uptake protein
MAFWKKIEPTTLSILGFAGAIGVGAILLMLPISSTVKNGLHFVDALFTATSAICVTGLVVLDTGKDLTLFGQTVVLTLIQAGGLGIMSLSTAIMLMVRRRPSLTGFKLVEDTFTHSGDRSLSSLLVDVILFTVIIEGAGCILLFFRFLKGRTVLDAAYQSVFHCISAFCNAGFSTFPDGLMGFRDDWVVNLVVCALIVSGGIGFLVLSELKRNFPFGRQTWLRLSLHSKLVIFTTAILIVGGTVSILIMEWRNTLASLSIPDRILASLFQSVTARTAGFNTLPIGQMANETLYLLIILMFIGASPGSCGGGIKTGTFMTLVVLSVSRLWGHHRPWIFHRSISQEAVGKAVSVVLLSFGVVVAATMLLLTIQLGGAPHSETEGSFMALLFEMVSAFGTVGLSMGVTTHLTAWAKFVITVVMFIGRLGPLVIGVAVSRKRAATYYYAEENIMIG